VISVAFKTPLNTRFWYRFTRKGTNLIHALLK